MFITADQINATNQAAFDTTKALAAKSYAGFEKLVELNMAAAKALMTESFSNAQAALAVKDLQQALALQTSLVAPLAEKSVSYSRHVYGIAVETGAEFSKAAETRALKVIIEV